MDLNFHGFHACRISRLKESGTAHFSKAIAHEIFSAFENDRIGLQEAERLKTCLKCLSCQHEGILQSLTSNLIMLYLGKLDHLMDLDEEKQNYLKKYLILTSEAAGVVNESCFDSSLARRFH